MFDAGGWSAAQRTTGRMVIVDVADGSVTGKGAGVDPDSGALLVQQENGAQVAISSGEVVRCRVV
jgi:biotin-(acetyl-CoA carboxylase) ligase